MDTEDLRLFINVVEAGSFTGAAEQEDLPTSTLSRRIRKLEDELGVRLLERTTRRLRLTELGEEFYQRSLHIVEEADTARSILQRKQDKPSGRLRIYAPAEFTRVHFQDVLPAFAEQHPDMTIEVFTSDGGRDLVHSRIDVLIHIEEPEDSSYIAKKNRVGNDELLRQPGIPGKMW